MLTLRQLVVMAKAKQTSLWDHTASLLSMLYSVNRGKNSPVRKPKDFHPFPPEQGTKAKLPVSSKSDLHKFKKLFTKQIEKTKNKGNPNGPRASSS